MWDLADDVHAARGEVRANSQELPPAVASKRLFQVRGLQRLHEALNWVPAPSAHLRPLALAVRHDLRKARVATRSVASGRRRGPAGLELAAAGRSPSDKWLAASDRRQEATAAGRAGSKRRASWDGHRNRSARRQQARRRRAWSRERRCHRPGRGRARSRSSNCPTPDPAPRGTWRARGSGRICNDQTAKKAGAPATATTLSREQQAVSRAAAASTTGRQRPASWLSPRPPGADDDGGSPGGPDAPPVAGGNSAISGSPPAAGSGRSLPAAVLAVSRALAPTAGLPGARARRNGVLGVGGSISVSLVAGGRAPD